MNSLTKANSLKIINKFNNKLVPQFLFFNKQVFLSNKNACIKKIIKKFKKDIIIRSSAINEDNNDQSNAGYYDSYVIKKNNFDDIEKKIMKLIRKFRNNKDQILVQKFVQNPDIAGVIFSKDKTTNSHTLKSWLTGVE